MFGKVAFRIIEELVLLVTMAGMNTIGLVLGTR